MIPLVFLLLGLIALGLPLFAGLLGATMLGLLSSHIDLAAIPIEILRLANAPVLLAIPLFTFAGYLVAEGGTTARLIRLVRSLLGWLPGGVGVVALFCCALFTAITGATGITIIALGGVLLPGLLAEGYDEDFALGLMTVSGSLGLLYPPSLPVILYGFVSGVSIPGLFLAGLLPGTLMVAALSLYAVRAGRKRSVKRVPFARHEFLAALRGAAWELPIPFLVVYGIYSGLMTVHETAAATVIYVLFIKRVVFRELRLGSDVPRVMRESMKMVGGILVILGAALAFNNFLVDALVPMKVLSLVESVVQSRLACLLLLNALLIAVGCLMDIFSAILVVVPLIAPLAERFGIDPLHLGVIFLANLGIGYNTPPVGLNLFIAGSRFEKPLLRVYGATLPFLLLLLVSLALITYWPALSLWLPSLLQN